MGCRKCDTILRSINSCKRIRQTFVLVEFQIRKLWQERSKSKGWKNERLARAKAKGESAFQKNYAPERIYYETYKDLTDPGKKQAFGDSIQQEFPEAFAEFAAYIQPSIRQNSNIGQNFIGTIPSRKEGKDRRFQFDQMIAGGIYFKPDTKKLYQRDPEKNILIELDPYSGKKLRELPLK